MGYGSGMGSRVVCLGRGNVGHACSGQAEQKRYIINLGGIMYTRAWWNWGKVERPP
jgi:hypothetical protein